MNKIFTLALLCLSFSQQMISAQQFQVNERGDVLIDGQNTGYRYNEQGQLTQFRYPRGGQTDYWRPAEGKEAQWIQDQIQGNQQYDQYKQYPNKQYPNAQR